MTHSWSKSPRLMKRSGGITSILLLDKSLWGEKNVNAPCIQKGFCWQKWWVSQSSRLFDDWCNWWGRIEELTMKLMRKICASIIFFLSFLFSQKDHRNRSRLNSREHFVVIILANVYDGNASELTARPILEEERKLARGCN